MKKSLIAPILKGLDKDLVIERLCMILAIMDNDTQLEEIIYELADGVVASVEEWDSYADDIVSKLRAKFMWMDIISVESVEVKPIKSIIKVKIRTSRWFRNADDANAYALADVTSRYKIDSSYRQVEEYPFELKYDDVNSIEIPSSELSDFGFEVNNF